MNPKKLLTPRVSETSVQKLRHYHQSRGPKRLDKKLIPSFFHLPRHKVVLVGGHRNTQSNGSHKKE